MSADQFGETRAVAITVLVDNRADLLVQAKRPTVRRFTREPLLAEHGFAALVKLEEANLSILWDAGMGEDTLMENMRRMRLDSRAIGCVAVSHGHRDHIGGLSRLLRTLHLRPAPRRWRRSAESGELCAYAEGRTLPVIAHPAAFRERWWISRNGVRRGPYVLPRAEWEALGARVVLSEGPVQLAPGCWTTGTIPRASFEPKRALTELYYRDREVFLPDAVEDDQALVLHIAGKGLVVLAGCAHAGIINTVRYAQEISGIDTVWAVLGGFHLASSSEEQIEHTMDEFERMKPVLVAPSHCTSFEAMCRFARRMPDVFVENVVGTTYIL